MLALEFVYFWIFYFSHRLSHALLSLLVFFFLVRRRRWFGTIICVVRSHSPRLPSYAHLSKRLMISRIHFRFLLFTLHSFARFLSSFSPFPLLLLCSVLLSNNALLRCMRNENCTRNRQEVILLANKLLRKWRWNGSSKKKKRYDFFFSLNFMLFSAVSSARDREKNICVENKREKIK
jgi:hypothetical protein